MEQMTQALVEAKRSLADARSSAQEIRRLEAEELAAKRGLEGAAQRLKQHRDLANRIDVNRQIEIDLMKELPEHHAREQEARATLSRTQEQIANADKDAQALAVREQQLERLVGAAVRSLRRDDLVRQLKTLEQAAKDLLKIDAQLSRSSREVEGN